MNEKKIRVRTPAQHERHLHWIAARHGAAWGVLGSLVGSAVAMAVIAMIRAVLA
jgi:hypothetical protein